MRFGTGGVPISCTKRSTAEGIKCVKSLGLDAMEIEFVRGVKMKEDMAQKIKELSQELDVWLSVHAPYYINFCSEVEETRKKSRIRLFEAARVGYLAGARDIVFHPGYYGNRSSEEALDVTKKEIEEVLNQIEREGLNVILRPETMGGLREFGSLDEIILLCREFFPKVQPCIDFAHLYARSLGQINNKRAFSEILQRLKAELGDLALQAMHIHCSGMEYGEKGEVRHLELEESEFDFKALIEALLDYSVEGVIISETPVMEKGALLLKKIYYGGE